MKKIVALLLALSIMFSFTAAFAENEVNVTLDGAPIEFDVSAQIIDDRTMVPMRKIFESLNASVEWIADEQIIYAVKQSKIITMKIGAPLLVVADIAAGEQNKITLDVPPMIVNDRTLVPLRAISESLGVGVNWDGETRTVILTSK